MQSETQVLPRELPASQNRQEKKKEHTKAKAKVKDEGHGQETWLRVGGRALPSVTKGCEVQKAQDRRGLGLFHFSVPLYRLSLEPEKSPQVLQPSRCFPIS